MLTDPWDAVLALFPPDLVAAEGAVAAVVAGLLLGVLAGRMRVSPASRAAVVALYAVAVLVTDLGSGPAVDGTGLLLLVAAATGAVGGTVLRSVLALLLLACAVVVMPVAGVGGLVLLAGMALTGDLGRRLGRLGRVAVAAVAVAAAGGMTVVLARPDELPALAGGPFAVAVAVAVAVPAVLSAWTLLVVGVLWRRQPWLRPVGVAVAAVLACTWVPGPDVDAMLIVGAAVALLSAIAAEDTRAVLARRAFVAFGALAVAAATVLLTPQSATPLGPVPAQPVALVAPGGAAVGAVPDPAVRPVSLVIPAIGVAGPLEDLVADPVTRELSAPADPGRAGWFAAGVVPGEQGPAVIGGHVDSRSGPGVFFRLGSLRPGDLVQVTRSDGQVIRFSVLAVHRYPKDAFPTYAVYGPTTGPELRLVTCGGRFDRRAHSYDDNVVIDTTLV